MTPEEFAQVFSRFVNGASREDLEEVADEITSDHRTLQQCSMGMLMMCVDNWADAEKGGCYDLRNEAPVLLSKQIKVVADDAHLPFI